MNRRLASCVFVMIVALAIVAPTSSARQAKPAATPPPAIVLEMAKGMIEIDLMPTEAPKTVAHVLDLVRHDFYRGLRFHWVQASLVQFGDPLSRDVTRQERWGSGGSGHPVGVAEISKRHFVRGSVGLAYRTGDKPEEADSQIFILKAANSNLDGKYTLIGQVTKGMEVIDKIEVSDIIKLVRLKQ
jgi:peptidylprolyl isomerase